MNKTSLPQHPATLSPGTLRDLRDLRADDLLVELEVTKWDYLRTIDAGAPDDDHSQLLRTELIAAIEREINTRKRLLNAGHHPMASGLRTVLTPAGQRIANDAKDLKRLWPIERFLTDVVAVELVRSGTRLRGRCPLPDHDDTSPSFVVYAETDTFHCFGCGESGDIYTLTRLLFRLDRFLDQVARVKDATASMIGCAR